MNPGFAVFLGVSVRALCLCGEKYRDKNPPQRHKEFTETQSTSN